jgi:N-acetylglucosaminyldiphosphoundecaprenol N-acetyl-beta-D-mannosaminyltransferase
MEWSWRLLMEPRKMWKRYLLTNTKFLWSSGREVLARRLGSSPAQRGEGPPTRNMPSP